MKTDALAGREVRRSPRGRCARLAPVLLAGMAGALIGGVSAAASTNRIGNLSPAEAQAEFETEPGFAVDLVAAEPLTVDPVALAFDERGRLFVAEDRDYPVGSPDGRPLGVIACLEDTDGDGRMDRRTEFARDLRFPNGVMPWRGGVIVTAAPDVWWLADTNGDGRADVRELWLTGFDTNATSQLRVNDPTLGPDGWIYFAGGLRGGKIRSPRSPERIVDTERGDLRYQPATGEMEVVAGKSQYGLAFDDAGERFACMNRVQSQHAPLPSRYLARNRSVVSPGALQNCPEIEENSLMTRYRAGATRYFPISANLTTADSHVGTYSAACAVHIYRGRNVPPGYSGAAFSCDPTGNLVRADRLEKVGGTFRAVRIHERTEALRSADNWFRPVFLADGPDGALYVADMYRKTIEHPDYLPGDVRKHTDFESGKSQGRIWRLQRATPDGEAGPRSQPDLRAAFGTAAGRLQSLSSTEPWIRDTAFRLLLEQPDGTTIPQLQAAFDEGGLAAAAVAHLRLLEALGGLTEPLLLRALAHGSPGVRQNGVLLAEPRLRTSAPLRDRVVALADDPDPHVRHQVALSLGELGDAGILPALTEIARRQGEDRWTRAAILTAAATRSMAEGLLTRLGAESLQAAPTPGLLALAADLAQQLALHDDGTSTGSNGVSQLWALLRNAKTDLILFSLAGYARGRGESFRLQGAASAADAARLVERARDLARLENAPLSQRVSATEWLAFDDSEATVKLLVSLLEPTQPSEVQVAAVRALVQPGRAEVIRPLLSAERWNAFAPIVRTLLVDRLMGRPEFSGALLDAISSGAIAPGFLTRSQREQLRGSRDPAVKARAESLLDRPGGDRQKAFEAAKAALALPPKPANGRDVFARACAQCHRLDQLGVAVGPDLFDIRQQPKEAILYHLILPEAEIAPNFVNYDCELKDGRLLSGLLAVESAAAITLRMAQGVEELVPRSRIARLTASRLSLMPQELEKTMSLQELADLLAYLRGELPPPGARELAP